MLLLRLVPLVGLAALLHESSGQSCPKYSALQEVVRKAQQCFVRRSTAKAGKRGRAKLRRVEQEAFQGLRRRVQKCFAKNSRPACTVAGDGYNVLRAQPLGGQFPNGVTNKNCLLCSKTLENIKKNFVRAPAARRSCVNTELVGALQDDLKSCQEEARPGEDLIKQTVPNFDSHSHTIQRAYVRSLNLGMAYRLKLMSCAMAGGAAEALATEQCIQDRAKGAAKTTCRINSACYDSVLGGGGSCAGEARAVYQDNCRCFGPLRANIYKTMMAIPDKVISKIGKTFDSQKCEEELLKEMKAARKANANSMSHFGDAENKCFGRKGQEAYSDKKRTNKICLGMMTSTMLDPGKWKNELRYQFAIVAAFTQATMDRFDRLCFC